MSVARGTHSRVLLDPHLRHIDPGPRARVAIITENHQTIVTITGVATAKASKAPSLIRFPHQYAHSWRVFQWLGRSSGVLGSPIFAAGT